MIENFQLNEPLFEGGINQIHQFLLTYDGTEYQGLFEDRKISWYHPKPENDLDEVQLKDLEMKVSGLLENYFRESDSSLKGE